MKFIHTSDLHLGRILNDVKLLDDQRGILDRILDVVREERPDAVIIAGDVYDRANPSGEAMRVFGGFLERLCGEGVAAIVISGNHDDEERIAYGGNLFSKVAVHPSPPFDGRIVPVMLEDGYGPVAVYPLPYVTSAGIRHAFPDEADRCATMSDAMGLLIEKMRPDPSIRNVLVAHQAVVGGNRSGSESVMVGGSEAVDPGVFEPFDYVALGHFHGAQSLDGGRIRYSGSPLKYSFNELSQRKSLTLVTLGVKGALEAEERALVPPHDLRELRGGYDELMDASFAAGQSREAYYRIVLTDDEPEYDVQRRLEVVYPHILECRYDNAATWAEGVAEAAPEDIPPIELFTRFHLLQAGREPGAEQVAAVRRHLEEIGGRG